MAHRAGSDRGAILIQTAIAIMVLTGLSAFVLDYGVMWLGRRQAQNAADAGALAAGTAILYDSYGDRTSAGPAHQSGLLAAQANSVFGLAAVALVDQSVDASSWIPSAPAGCLGTAAGSCAQSSVYRDGTNSSTALPTYFAQIFGQTSQKTRATATAQLRAANASPCLKPLIVPDKTDTSSYTFADIGRPLVLSATATSASGVSRYFQADFKSSGASSCPGSGTTCYNAAMEGCVGKDSNGTFQIGDVIQEKSGTITNTDGMAVYNQDSGATWNTSTNSVGNSCALSTCDCANNNGNGCANGLNGRVSPRILPIGLFRPTDVTAMAANGVQSGAIKNVAGLFLLRPGTGPNPACTSSSNNICGYLMLVPGKINSGTTPAQGGTLNVFLSLVR